MIEAITIYLLIGSIWLACMEYYTTKYKIGPSWNNGERVTQIIVWPIALVIFFVELYRNL